MTVAGVADPGGRNIWTTDGPSPDGEAIVYPSSKIDMGGQALTIFLTSGGESYYNRPRAKSEPRSREL